METADSYLVISQVDRQQFSTVASRIVEMVIDTGVQTAAYALQTEFFVRNRGERGRRPVVYIPIPGASPLLYALTPEFQDVKGGLPEISGAFALPCFVIPYAPIGEAIYPLPIGFQYVLQLTEGGPYGTTVKYVSWEVGYFSPLPKDRLNLGSLRHWQLRIGRGIDPVTIFKTEFNGVEEKARIAMAVETVLNQFPVSQLYVKDWILKVFQISV